MAIGLTTSGPQLRKKKKHVNQQAAEVYQIYYTAYTKLQHVYSALLPSQIIKGKLD